MMNNNTQINANMKANGRQSAILYPELSYKIQGAIFSVRHQYGPGQKGVNVEREKKINICSSDSGKIVGTYQPDMVADDLIVLEIKSSRFTTKTDEKQLYYYLRNSKYELGYLVNFSTPQLFMKRIVYSNSRKPWLKLS